MMKKTAVSVRRNIPKKLDSPSVPVLVQDQVPFKKAIDENMTRRLQISKGKHVEEEEDVFSDALDTLSLKDNISSVVEAMKPPIPSEEDPQPQDFMLNRFLPAAKSMTMDQQPQFALKRQPLPLISETMRQIRDIVPAESYCATPKRYESVTTSPSYYDEESEDDDEDYLYKRGCGMSPQVCFKNSLGMLTSSVHTLKEKPYSLRTSSSSKVAQLKSRFQSVKKLAQKLGSRAQSPVHPSIGNKFNFESAASMPSSPYRQTGCMSPYRSVGNSSPLHTPGFPGTRKEAEIMRANRLNKHIRNISKTQELLYPKSTRLDCSTSSVIEKTLYVDSNVKFLPETVETTVSEEPEMAVNKPEANLEVQPVESSGCDLSPLAPPPPKKPSDSWLFRNLPSVSSKISSRRYLFHQQKKNLEEDSISVVTKWETIVKTSCMHRDHIRYSEELVARSSCQSKT